MAAKKHSLTSLADSLSRKREVKKPEKTEETKEDSVEQAPPVSEEVVELLRQKAELAAQAEDAKREAEIKATEAKKDLLEFMQRYKIKSLPMSDREAIRVIPPDNGKDVTKRGLFAALKDNPEEAERIWNLIPKKEGGKPRLEVPAKRVEERTE